MDIRVAYLALTSDVISTHAFGKPLDMLHDDPRAVDWHKTMRAIPRSSLLIRQFLWIPWVAFKLPADLVALVFPDLARIVAMRHVSIRLNHEADQGRADFEGLEWVTGQAKAAIKNYDNRHSESKGSSGDKRDGSTANNLFMSILGKKDLPPKEKEAPRIAQEAFTTLAAGIGK